MSDGGYHHQHIAVVKWVNLPDHSTGSSTRQQMVDWIEAGGQAIVSDGVNTVKVHVVNASPKYIQTYADGKWTDNLLALPRY
jgi:hypothetical protein